MPRLRERDWNLQGHPTHPRIPTQKFVRYNLDFPEDHVSNVNLYTQYPFKTTPSGSRNAQVSAKELTDYKYTLTQKEWSSIIKSFGKYLHIYLLEGNTYKFPQWRLGTLRLVKRKRKTAIKYLCKKHKKRISWYVPQQEGYKLHTDWDRKRFRFQSLWNVTLPEIYHKLNENLNSLYNLSTK